MVSSIFPFLNPIEHFFGKVKAGLKKQHFSDELTLKREAIRVARTTVTRMDCLGWFRHCEKYHTACLLLQPIYVDVPELPTEDGMVRQAIIHENGLSLHFAFRPDNQPIVPELEVFNEPDDSMDIFDEF